MNPAFLIDSGVVCSLGVGAAQLSASFRCGLSGYVESPVVCRGSEPLVMALVPEEAVEMLSAARC